MAEQKGVDRVLVRLHICRPHSLIDKGTRRTVTCLVHYVLIRCIN